MTSGVRIALEPRERAVIGLIGSVHLVSHFYHLVLPPLFIFIQPELGVSYTELGIAMTLYFIATAIVQVPIGLMVDRIGARAVLIGGLMLMGFSLVLAGMVPNYTVLLVSFFIAGMGNAVFHPADFSILSNNVRESHQGRAFAFHTFGGSIGYAAAPVVMVPLGSIFGWEFSLTLAGLLGVLMGFLIFICGSVFQNRVAQEDGKTGVSKNLPEKADWRIMLTRPMILFFCFYVLTSAAGTGLTAFSIPALPIVYNNISPEIAGAILTCFLVAAIFGSLPGGWLADWVRMEYIVVVVCFAVMSLCVLLMGSGYLTLWLVFLMASIAGLMRGLYNASRDILVRRASPSRSVGTAFGFVTLGYTLGQGGTPVLYGWLMDQGLGSGVFLVAAGFAFLAMLIVLIPGQGQKPKS
ncbi:MAG: hypothetical protein CMM37_10675 [Rhodospirillaceae bacterium]|jgi:FSR family fosmidomycin resistance protein-like MFS transporter|nr:hypothetical protein [Rhodospirillaceae bacterium]